MVVKHNLKMAEAIIFASGDGISKNRLLEVLDIDLKQMQYIIDSIKEKYNSQESGIVFIENSETLLFSSNIEAAELIREALSVKKNSNLTNAAMESLAIIAYNQPVSRAFVEQVRGVDSTSSINTLVSRNLIEEAGRLDIPGRPISYKTTPVFLRSFSLNSLSDLPKIKSTTETQQISTDDLKIEGMEDEFNS